MYQRSFLPAFSNCPSEKRDADWQEDTGHQNQRNQGLGYHLNGGAFNMVIRRASSE